MIKDAKVCLKHTSISHDHTTSVRVGQTDMDQTATLSAPPRKRRRQLGVRARRPRLRSNKCSGVQKLSCCLTSLPATLLSHVLELAVSSAVEMARLCYVHPKWREFVRDARFWLVDNFVLSTSPWFNENFVPLAPNVQHLSISGSHTHTHTHR